jgi:hypothetical protein
MMELRERIATLEARMESTEERQVENSATYLRIEERLRLLEKYLWLGVGGLGALQVILTLVKR